MQYCYRLSVRFLLTISQSKARIISAQGSFSIRFRKARGIVNITPQIDRANTGYPGSKKLLCLRLRALLIYLLLLTYLLAYCLVFQQDAPSDWL